MTAPDLDALEAAYRAAEDRLASEQKRFSQTLSPRYSPARLMTLAAETARAREAYLAARFGRPERSSRDLGALPQNLF